MLTERIVGPRAEELSTDSSVGGIGPVLLVTVVVAPRGAPGTACGPPA